MDTFTITAYNVNTDVATVTFFINGVNYVGINLTRVPKDTVANVKAYMLAYVNAYKAGKAVEAARIAAISPQVAALLNVATSLK